MICDPCEKQFQKLELERPGGKITVDPVSAKELLNRKQYCTICCTILQDCTIALSAHLPDTFDKDEWYKLAARITKLSPFKAKIEKRIGRYSFIVGPCYDATFELDGNIVKTLDLDARLFILFPRSGSGQYPNSRKPLGKSTESLEAIQQAKDWLEACDKLEKHPECEAFAEKQKPRLHHDGRYNEEVFMPTRLVDVGTGDGEVLRFRIATTKVEEITKKYATLSHKWGIIKPGEKFVLTDKNSEEFMSKNGVSIEIKGLPRTFKHAMQVTKKLGLQYLWIDSLCIINDDGGTDFIKEAPTMENIYRQSYCNIAAVDSVDGKEGLFRNREPEQLPPDMVTFRNRSYALLRSDFWAQHLLQEPLYSRAWVVQERILTGRILHFAKEQLFFQCPSITACESSPASLPLGIQAEQTRLELKFRRALHQDWEQELDPADLYGAWKHIVFLYTSCDLTMSSDKFVALDGMASAVSRAMQPMGKYIAGLWDAESGREEDRRVALIPDQLGWQVKNGKNRHGKPAFRYIDVHPFDYRAPSWSWGCLEGVVELKDRIVRSDEVYCANVSDCFVNVKQRKSPCGAVRPEGTQMKIQGKVITVRLVQERHLAEGGGEDGITKAVEGLDLEKELDSDEELEQYGRWKGDGKWNEWRAYPEPESGRSLEDKSSKCRVYLDTYQDIKRLQRRKGDSPMVREGVVLLLRCHGDVRKGFSGHGLVLSEIKERPESHKPLCYTRLGLFVFEELPEDEWEKLSRSKEDVQEVILV